MEILVVILVISFLSFGIYCALNSNNEYLGISEGGMEEEKTYTEDEVEEIKSDLIYEREKHVRNRLQEVEHKIGSKDGWYKYTKDGFDISVDLAIDKSCVNEIRNNMYYYYRGRPAKLYDKPYVSISKDGHTIIEKRVKNKEEINKLIDNVIDKFTQYNKPIYLASLIINGRSKSYYMWRGDYNKLLEHWREQESHYLNVKPILEDEFTIPKNKDQITIKEEYRLE